MEAPEESKFEDVTQKANLNNAENSYSILSSSAFPILTHSIDPAFGVDSQAKIIAGLLERFSDEKGQFVGIFGQWGRGKTYFWERIKNFLDQSDTQLFETVTFHAWKYQDTPASWAYLYETLADQFFAKPDNFSLKGYWMQGWRKFKLAFRRGSWKKPALSIAISLLVSIPGFLKWFLESFAITIPYNFPSTIYSIWLTVPFVMTWDTIKKKYSTKAIDLFEKFSKSVSFEGYLGTQAEIQKEIIILLNTWFPNPEKRKLLLFVDDIDRCDEERIIQIVDALRVMLEDSKIVKRLIVLAAVDERILMRAIRNKYYDLVNRSKEGADEDRLNQLQALTREYMDKLFITGIKLPQLTANELNQYLDKLVKKLMDNSKKEFITESDIDKDSLSPGISTEYHLSNEEYNILQETILQVPKSATPRQIRIFTYRYMIAIRLLRVMKDTGGLKDSSNKFDHDENIILALMILEYGLLQSVHTLLLKKAELFSGKITDVTLSIRGKTFTKPIDFMHRLFEVLEMVIAY